VQVGNMNATVINKIMKSVNELVAEQPKFLKTAVELKRLRVIPGSAHGYNHGLKVMMSTDAEWTLVVKPGVVFEPGSLKKLSIHMGQYLQKEPLKFGMGFPVGLGSSWAGFALTRRLVAKVGFFDENFYPSQLEEADMAYRIKLSGFYGSELKNVYVSQGETITVGGVTLPSELVDEGGKVAEYIGRAAAGGASAEYYRRKWGADTACVDVRQACSLPYSLPFNREDNKLREWTLELNRRAYLISGKGERLEVALAADKDKEGGFDELGVGARHR